MEETDFAGNLDPTAQEFWPSYPVRSLTLIPVLPVATPPPVFYTPSPAPVLPPATLPPTRSLLLSSVPLDVSESTIRRDLEWFGDVRAVQMGRLWEGIVAVHFYDLRAAHAALEHIRVQHMQHQHRLRVFYSQFPAGVPPPLPPPAKGLLSGRVVWAQFVVPAINAFPDGHNQGTLVLFNLHSHISASNLAQYFSIFGPIREMRDTPTKRHQKFVEFYDVRHAAMALVEMNGKEIGGKRVMIEFSRPGGFGRRAMNASFSQKFLPPLSFLPPRAQAARRTSPPRGKSGTSSSSSQQQPFVSSSKKSLESSIGELSLNRKSDDSETLKLHRTKTSWKGGRHNRSLDPRFLIKEDAVIDPDSKDSPRTTLMIKNIPNKYSQKLLLNMLDNHCIHYNEQKVEPLSSYDFLYLPIDFNNKCNVGYGFVNMTSPEAALRLYKSFHQQPWEVFNSRKICEVTYARVQGLEALKEHFKNSKFACETEEYMPVVFSPARDGRANLTEPLPIVPIDDVGWSAGGSNETSMSGGEEEEYHDESDVARN